MAKKPAKKLGRKELKKTKGGILIGLNQPIYKLPPPPPRPGAGAEVVGIDFRP